jgi:ketosteroid isomerase-like protein
MTLENDVRAVSAAWDAALVRNDADAVASYMTDNWVFVSPDGITPKADIIGWIAAGRLAHHSMSPVGQDRVVRAGDTVVMTARKTSSGSWDGVPYTADEWISEVFVQTDAGWRCVISHKAPVAGVSG